MNVADMTEYEQLEYVRASQATADELLWLAEHGFERVCTAIADKPMLPFPVCEVLAKNGSDDVLWVLSSQHDFPAQLMPYLAQSKDAFVRENVAWHPNAPSEVLVQLAEDSEVGVRQGVADHSATPVETLEALARQKNAFVRMYVAGNSNTPEHVLREMSAANDFDEVILLAFMSNRNAPVDVLRDGIARFQDDLTVQELGELCEENLNKLLALVGDCFTLAPRSMKLTVLRTWFADV